MKCPPADTLGPSLASVAAGASAAFGIAAGALNEAFNARRSRESRLTVSNGGAYGLMIGAVTGIFLLLLTHFSLPRTVIDLRFGQYSTLAGGTMIGTYFALLGGFVALWIRDRAIAAVNIPKVVTVLGAVGSIFGVAIYEFAVA